jgi:hypothetical protein
LRPRLTAGLPLSRRQSVSACENEPTNLEASILYATWPFISMPRQARSYARGLLLSANFGECPKGEVRRILIPRTRVNKGKKKGPGIEVIEGI